MPTVTTGAEATGTLLSITSTIADNHIEIPSTATSLNVYLEGANDGTFSIGVSTGPVILPKTVWVEVFRRETPNNTGNKTIYFAVSTGTTNLQYRVV